MSLVKRRDDRNRETGDGEGGEFPELVGLPK